MGDNLPPEIRNSIDDTAEQLRLQNLELVGITEAGEDTCSKLGLHFNARGCFNLSDARLLALNSMAIFINKINENDKTAQYLSTVPFTQKNVQIGISFHDENNEEVYEPWVASVTATGRYLLYHYLEPGKLAYSHTEEESFEEALERLEQPINCTHFY